MNQRTIRMRHGIRYHPKQLSIRSNRLGSVNIFHLIETQLPRCNFAFRIEDAKCQRCPITQGQDARRCSIFSHADTDGWHRSRLHQIYHASGIHK